MAPEVLRGQPYDAKADAWSAGCVLHELCTLRRTFDAPNLGAVTLRILKCVALLCVRTHTPSQRTDPTHDQCTHTVARLRRCPSSTAPICARWCKACYSASRPSA